MLLLYCFSLREETKTQQKCLMPNQKKSDRNKCREDAGTSNRTMDSATANLPVNGTDSGAKDKPKEVISQTNCHKREHEMKVVVLDVLLPTEAHLADWKKR